MKLLFSICLSLSSFCIMSQELDDIINVLKHVESRNQPHLIGDNGKAYGILQIHDICIRDTNRLCGTKYVHTDAFNEKHSVNIFNLIIRKGIQKFINKFGISPTEKDIVRMWNGGIYNGYRKHSTLKYYAEYLRMKKLLDGL